MRNAILCLSVLLLAACTSAPAPATVASSDSEWVETTLGRAVRMGPGMKGPAVLRHVNPIFPGADRNARTSGPVELEVLIGPTGTVASCKVLLAPSPTLGEAARQAASQWLFAPTVIDGHPVPVVFSLTINFKLP